MAEVMSWIVNFQDSVQGETGLVFTLLLLTAVIVIYAIFVFYFYRFLAKKNIIELNLGKYNKYESSGLFKFIAVMFYILEYLILLPLLTFFWFAVLSILIMVLADKLSVSTVLIIAASLVAAVRTTSYVSQNLSQDLAKMLPFTLLGIAITQPGFFLLTNLFGRISEIPTLFSNLPYYLIFIISLELVMRLLDFISGVLKSEEEVEEEIINQTEE